MKRFFFFTVFFFCSGLAQDESSSFLLFPSGQNFTPLKAHIEEPRIGVFKSLDNSEMKVDIGNAVDVIGFEHHGVKVTAGIDFMAYAFVTGNQGLRLQIDAIDGFFGGDLSVTAPLANSTNSFSQNLLQMRLRILHHSAHLADGHYLSSTSSWIDNRQPIPFTTDFGELVVAHDLLPSFGTLRYYAGVSYATLVRPTDIQRFAYLGGIEVDFDNIFGPIVSQPTNLFCAYNITFNGTPVYAASHQFQAGTKFGRWQDRGIVFYFAYYNGRQMFGEYFDEKLTTIGAGFTVDFF